MIGRACLGFSLLFSVLLGAGPALAQSCTSADFGAVVDQTAQALRELNGSGSKRYQGKVAALREKFSLTQAEIEARTTGLNDDKIEGFNREVESLVGQMDVLSQTPSSKVTCEKLDELKRVRDRLLAVMGEKSNYILAKIEGELNSPGTKSNPQMTASANPATLPEPPRAAPPAPAPQTPVADKAPVAPQAPVADKAPAAPQAPVADKAPVAEKAPPIQLPWMQQPSAQAPTAPTPTAQAPAAPQAPSAQVPAASAPAAQAPAPIKPPSVAETRPRPASEPKPTPLAPVKPAPSTTAAAPDYAPPPALPERNPPPPARVARNNAPSDLSPSAPLNDSNRPTPLAPPPYSDGAAPRPGAAPLQQPPADQGYSIAEIREAGKGIFGSITAEFAGAINYAFQQFGTPNAYITGGEGGGAFLAGLRYGKGTFYRKAAEPVEIFWQGPSAGLDFGAEGGQALFLVYNLEDPTAIYGRFSGIGGAAYVAGGVGLNVLGKGGVIMVPIRSGLGLRLGANLAYVKFTERQTWNPF